MPVKPEDILPPGQERDETKLVRFITERCYRSSPLYASDFANYRKAELYDQSEQWLQRAYTTRDSRYPSQWVQIDYDPGDPNSIPLPVYNEMVAIRENESARLTRPEYKPRVRPRGENPGITERDASEAAERALRFRMDQMAWEHSVEGKCGYNMPMYGGAYLMSFWDQTWMDTVRVPAASVVCSRNPRVQPSLPMSAAAAPPQNGNGAGQLPTAGIEETVRQGGLPTASPMSGAIFAPGAAGPPCPFVATLEQAQQQNVQIDPQGNPQSPCPLCGSRLLPYKPTLEEAVSGGLGKDWPKGDWHTKVPWPDQIFVRDAGVGVDPAEIDEWVYAHVETIDWIAERYPDKVRDPETGLLKIHPEHPTALMAEHPVLGAPPVFQSASRTETFWRHTVVYEYCRRPWLEWDKEAKAYKKNEGRHTVAASGRVCVDEPLMVESFNSPGKMVPRIRLEYVHWEPKEGGRRATSGQSLWDRLYDAQDGINERMAQVRAVNQRGALPWYLQQRGRNFETRAADSTIPFRRVMCDIDPNDKQPPLTLMQNTTIDAGVYQEVEYGKNFAQRVSGQVEVERGQVPPNVAAATAIAYLKTESGEKRRPRIRRLRQAFVRTWQHGMELMSALYIEPREYSYEDEQSEERWAFIQGDVIASANPKVDIYPTPDYDQQDALRESIRDMVQLRILNPTQTPQLNRKIVRTLEPSFEAFLDDDLQEQQASREWRDFKQYGKVPVIDPSLDDPMTHFQLHGQACFSPWFREMEARAGWDQALGFLGSDWDQSLAAIAMQKPPGTSLQTLIFQWWMMRATQAQFQPPDPNAFKLVLLWRAHMEAHKLTVLVQQATQARPVQAPAKGSAPAPASEGAGVAGPM